MRYMLTVSFVAIVFSPNISASDDFLQKQLRERAKWSQAISRISEIIEVAEESTVYAENPSKLVITISDTSTITVTGTIARRAYEAARDKKNRPPVEDAQTVLAFMRQFSDGASLTKPACPSACPPEPWRRGKLAEQSREAATGATDKKDQ
jgi:hypothetical protein